MAATEKEEPLLRSPLHRRLLAAMGEDDTLSLIRALTVEEFLALAPEQSFACVPCMHITRVGGALMVENGTWE